MNVYKINIQLSWYMASYRLTNGAIAIGYGSTRMAAVEDCIHDASVIFEL